MKKILLIACIITFALAAAVPAAELTLEWIPNNEALEGFRIYQRVDGQAYDYSQPIHTLPSTSTSHTVTGLENGVTYFFVIRAFDGDYHSEDSNEIVYTPDERFCLNLLTATGDNITEIQAGTYLIDGYPDLMAVIQPVPEDNDNPPYSTNSSRTIYHHSGCRWYDPSRGIADPADCPTCRPCKICGGSNEGVTFILENQEK